MAKLIPSAEMPKPENIGRIVTGPKSENKSIRKSRSMMASLRRQSLIVRSASCASRTMRPRSRPRPSFETPRKRAAPQMKPAHAGKEVSDLSGRQLHGFATAASAGLVRIVEDELRRHPVDLVVHLGAQQEQHGLGIDQDLHALVLDDLVGRANLVGVLDRIGLPGAAAVLDADPQAHDLGIGAFG